MSRQYHNNSDAGLFQQAIVERTLAGEDDWTEDEKAEAQSPTVALQSGSLLPLLSAAQVRPPANQANPLSFSNQKSLKSQASAVIERYQGQTQASTKVNLDSVGSLALLRHISMDLDPRASAIWRKNERIASTLARRDKQEEFFKSYLNDEIKQVSHFAAMPSLEALYAQHKHYHPNKVRISLDTSVNQSLNRIPAREGVGYMASQAYQLDGADKSAASSIKKGRGGL